MEMNKAYRLAGGLSQQDEVVLIPFYQRVLEKLTGETLPCRQVGFRRFPDFYFFCLACAFHAPGALFF